MTSKRQPENERTKRRYLQFLREVKGRDEASLDAVAKAIERFDEYNRRRDFRKFHTEQACGFKAHLMEQRNARTGAPGLHHQFHPWGAEGVLRLFGRRSAVSRSHYADAQYFNAPENLARVATAHRRTNCPTMAQIRSVLDAMPATTEIERRERALVAFAILTGGRDSAIASFKLKHIDLEHELLEQDAREVRTKRAKTFTTWFFSRRRNHSADRCRMGQLPANRKRLWPGRSYFSEVACGSRPRPPLRGERPASTGRIGPTRTGFAPSSRARSKGSACLISTRVPQSAGASRLRPQT